MRPSSICASRPVFRWRTIYYAFVLDAQQKLQGVVSFRELFAAPGNQLVREFMETDIISVPAEMDGEEVAPAHVIA